MKILATILTLALSAGYLLAAPKASRQAKARVVVAVKAPAEKATYLGVYAVKLSPVVSRQLGLDGNLYLSVEQVNPGSPAEKAGVEKYDILKKLDDQVLVNNEQLRDLVRSRKVDEEVTLTILRGGKEKTLTAKLAQTELPRAQARANAIPRIGNFGNDRQGGIRVLPGGGAGAWALPGGGDIGDLGERIRRQMERQREQLEKRGIAPRFGRGLNLNDPDLIEKFDADGDGKLSPMERDKARAEGAVPELNFDFDLDFGLGAPNVDDLLRDARRRGASSSWSSVTGSAQTKVVKIDDDGTFEFSSSDGKKRFKATDPDGKVLFDGPVDTKAQRAEMPEDLRDRLESIEGGVNIRIRQGGGKKLFPKPKPKIDPLKDDRLL